LWLFVRGSADTLPWAARHTHVAYVGDVTHARLKLYIFVDLPTLRFKETELLTRDVIVE
jgi:hypothetical protein